MDNDNDIDSLDESLSRFRDDLDAFEDKIPESVTANDLQDLKDELASILDDFIGSLEGVDQEQLTDQQVEVATGIGARIWTSWLELNEMQSVDEDEDEEEG